MYRIIVLFFLITFSFSIKIDPILEKSLEKNDIVTRLMLVNYYLDKNITKANMYNNQVLRLDKNNKQAKLNKIKIEKRKELLKILDGKNVDDFYKNLYFNNKYEEIKKLSTYLSVIKSDYPKLITARIYLWDGKYKKVAQILRMVKDTNTLDYTELHAYELYYTGYYIKAKKDFYVLYQATGKLEYAYKYIDCLLYLGEIETASKFVKKLLKEYPLEDKLLAYEQKIKEKEKAQLDQLMQNYENDQTFDNLQPLIYYLMNINQKTKAYYLLEEYIKNHPGDINAKYWYAKYLAWDGEYQKALNILNQIVTEHDYKIKLLIAKIYAWDGKYKKAINYINDIILNSQNPNLIVDAKELKGLIYFWQQNYELAKPVLEDVLKHKKSVDVKEALMVINGNLKPLIEKYKKLYKKDPSNLEYILKVAQYSEKIGDIDTAIKFYEKYNKLNPNNLNIAHTLAQLYLAKKDYYKGFSLYEYWAYKRGDVKSLYELAKNYYYAGFSKSALNVINDILKIKDYRPALTLKAQILRYSPKFVTNNDTKTITDIFSEKNSKLLEIGNRLYFNGFYSDASNYYNEYLLSKPNDADIRERYAYSLEFSGKYPEASGEFFLVTWHKKNCEILYHYGYNLEKTGKYKLAKQIYKDALKYAVKPAPKFILNFIEQWKKAWESKDIFKYKQFYDDKYKKSKIWTIKKQSIFDRVKFISLYLKDISVINAQKSNGYNIYTVKFWQKYTTNKKTDEGYKTLVLKCKNHKCIIESEKWTKAKYIPQDYQCDKHVNMRLNNMSIIPVNNINILTPPQNKEIIKKKVLKKKVNKVDGITKGGIVIVDNVKRNLKKAKEILNYADINMTKKFNIKKGDVNVVHNTTTVHNFGLLGYYYEDKTSIKENNYGVFYKTNKLYFDINKWKLWQKDNKRDGKYLTFHYKINKWTLGTEIGEYENNTYLYPYVEYSGYFNYLYSQSVAGKDKESFCAIDNKLISHHIVLSKYKGLTTKDNKELTDFWYSLELSKITNNEDISQLFDTIDKYVTITPQFMYRFRTDNIKDLEFYYYLSGWYQFNTDTTDCYYSPKKYDSTYIELHPVYKKLELIGKIGYSFDGQSKLYSYGFDFSNKWLSVGCMKNYSYKEGFDSYWYEECNLKAGVNW